MKLKQYTDHLMHVSLYKKYIPKINGYGIFTKDFIEKDEILIIFGGKVMNIQTFNDSNLESKNHALQIDYNIFLVSSTLEDPDFVNHSCNPNAGFCGQITLIAMQNIFPNEEITFDYAMVDMSEMDEFDCQCNKINCRKKIKGTDWKLKELHQKYANYFGTHVLREIKKLNL